MDNIIDRAVTVMQSVLLIASDDLKTQGAKLGWRAKHF